MACTSPNITSTTSHQKNNSTSYTDYLQAEFGFIMDNVVELLNYSASSNETFHFYPDPIYYLFEDGMMVLEDEFLVIMVCITFIS